ncbi:MAG TPA: glycosyltransferase family 1 protein [Chloroflexota bacterium]|nr:glycosyltransferase family 1 protein [Chloroflexota bacterium]
MQVGIDLSCWSNYRGYGRYTRNLVDALLVAGGKHSYVGFCDRVTAREGTFPSGLKLVTVATSQAPTQAATAYGRRRVSDMWRMAWAVFRSGVDLMFFPSSYTYFPVLPRTRCVIVVHDAIAERWPKLIFPTWTGRLAWTAKSRMAGWQADRVITVSHNAADAIHAHLGISTRRLRVIYEAADPVFRIQDASIERERQVREQYGIPPTARLLLYVGGFSPHKNLEALLAAFARLVGSSAASEPRDEGPLHLALVGETTREAFFSCYTALCEQIGQLGLESRVTFTGFVPDADLVQLYRTAVCLVLPSRDEGFGLPVVEAMACGTPVVTSRGGALPELVGEAGILVDPDRTDDFADALRRVSEDVECRAELRERGLRRASQLDWNVAAADLLRVFDELDPTARVTAGPNPSELSPGWREGG